MRPFAGGRSHANTHTLAEDSAKEEKESDMYG